MAEVFISYSSIDSEKANEILERLEGTGISCWLSQRDIPPGADYAIEIPKAIISCSYFVLLLTNAAQNSPYVMLELDQAFKQKKEIIPILLEPVVESEKTNFFLNAKQKLDGTKNLTPAVNEVIRRIRPDFPKAQAVTEKPRKSTAVRQYESVRCPYCGCTILKRRRLFVDRYLYPKEGRLDDDATAVWLIEKREIITSWISIITAIGLIATIIWFIAVTEKEIFTVILLLVFGVMHGVFCIGADIIGSKTDILGALIGAIRNSGLKYWTFRCAGCEKNFSILLPIEDDLKDRVPNLLEDNNR